MHTFADASEMSHCLVRILVQRHNWAIFSQNEQGEAVTVNGDRFRAMVNEFLFTKIEEEDIGNIWFQQGGATCHTAEAILDVLRPVFEDRIISRRVNVFQPSRSCDLTPLDYYLWGAVKDKRYALKDNIREAIDEIQLHTIDNVVLSYKKNKFEKIFRSYFFSKHFPKKGIWRNLYNTTVILFK